jgi:hypothetical protein
MCCGGGDAVDCSAKGSPDKCSAAWLEVWAAYASWDALGNCWPRWRALRDGWLQTRQLGEALERVCGLTAMSVVSLAFRRVLQGTSVLVEGF